MVAGDVTVNVNSPISNYIADFDGVDDYIVFNDSSNPNYDVFNMRDFTIYVKFRTKISTTNIMMILDNKTAGTANTGFNLFLDTAKSGITFRVSNGAAVESVGSTGISGRDGEWHEALCIKNGTGLFIYFDSGNSVNNSKLVDLSTWNIRANNALYMGNWGAGAGGPLNGQIIEHAIWKKELSAEDIKKVFLGKISSESLTHNVKYIDGTSKDYSINEIDGTLNGTIVKTDIETIRENLEAAYTTSNDKYLMTNIDTKIITSHIEES